MDENLLKKLHNLKREDERRAKVLLDGVKLILAEKKEATLMQKWFKSKSRKKMPEAKGWN